MPRILGVLEAFAPIILWSAKHQLVLSCLLAIFIIWPR
jgi:hypothetical protein